MQQLVAPSGCAAFFVIFFIGFVSKKPARKCSPMEEIRTENVGFGLRVMDLRGLFQVTHYDQTSTHFQCVSMAVQC